MSLIVFIFYSIFIYVIRLFHNNIITSMAYVILIVVCGIYDITRLKGFIHKTFECLICGQSFKPKWYKLMFFKWRVPLKYRAYKELETGTFEKLIYKCPKCKNRECVAK